MRSLPTKSGSSFKVRARPSNSGCCPPGPAKPSRSPTIRSTTSGPAGFRTASASFSRATNRARAFVSIPRIFPEELRNRFLPKASTQPRSRFHRMASWLSEPVPTKKGTSTRSPEAILASSTVLDPGDIPIIWNKDGRSIYLYRTGEVPAKVYQLDLASGKKTLRQQIVPVDTTGVSTIGPIQTTPDGKTYVYGFHRTLGDLYLVEGLK